MEHLRLYALVRPLVPKPLRGLTDKHQHTLCYIFFGCLTVLVNLGLYGLLEPYMSYAAAVALSWLGSVIVAFITNKLFVFEERSSDLKSVLRQGLSFGAARLFSLGLEEVLMFVMIERMGLKSFLAKVIAQAAIVIPNYLFSKLIVFKRRGS